VTNRDLYLAVLELSRGPAAERPLEEFLRALWRASHPLAAQEALSPEEFLALLNEAAVADAPPYQHEWVAALDIEAFGMPAYRVFETNLLEQIVDIHEMAAAGLPTQKQPNQHAYSPRQNTWRNVDTAVYLEHAARGTFHWTWALPTDPEAASPLSRVGAEDGTIVVANPPHVLSENTHLQQITWDHFMEFLRMGQWHS
jgi:hypothetical protein